MRVLIVNTSERTGGAAVAAKRLMEALNNNGVKAKMLVAEKVSQQLTVASLPHPWMQRLCFLWERWCIFYHLHFTRGHLFEIDIANAGVDITQLREFREADIIHLSWINQGMLSLSVIRRILRSGKPVVWTMHDLWPASGICHYAHGCTAFATGCRQCPLLPAGGSPEDLSTRVWNKKRDIYAEGTIHFVTCSQWLERQARKSRLLEGQSVCNIPNPIDTHIYSRKDKALCRQATGLPTDRKLILFVSQRVTDGRKGMAYFVEAVNRMVAERPELRLKVGVAVLGGHAEEVAGAMNLPTYPLGYVSDERRIVDIYNAVDVYVLPSLEDNLPNTIMEAMACGLPCVGFRVGGIPEMIDHEVNGYVANFKDAEDLARGMMRVLTASDYERLSYNAVHKVLTHYSGRTVAMRYIDVYNQALTFKKCNL